MPGFELQGPVPPGSGPLTRLMAPEYSGRVIDPIKHEFVVTYQHYFSQHYFSNPADVRSDSPYAGIAEELVDLNWGVEAILGAVEALRDQLVSRFDAMLQYMNQQNGLLASIDDSLKNPHRVQASERIKQSVQCLNTKQFDWALQYAREAVEHDATNPGSFMAAGWAHVGMGQTREAVGYFSRATHVATEYQPWLDSMRQLARCQIVVDDGRSALVNLEAAIGYVEEVDRAENQWKKDRPRSRKEPKIADLAALHYEASMAAASSRNNEAAKKHIETAVRMDRRYAQLAAGEPYFAARPGIVSHALGVVKQIDDDNNRRNAEQYEQHERRAAKRERKERRQTAEQEQAQELRAVTDEEVAKKMQKLAEKRAKLLPFQAKYDEQKLMLKKLLPWRSWLQGEQYERTDELLESLLRAQEQLDEYELEAEKEQPDTDKLEQFLSHSLGCIDKAFELWSNIKPAMIDRWFRTADKSKQGLILGHRLRQASDIRSNYDSGYGNK